jgi:hypothetical protein
MLIFDGCLVRKNGHMTITILSIAHMGIPNILKFSFLYIEIQLLIWPFPWDLCHESDVPSSFSTHLQPVMTLALTDIQTDTANPHVFQRYFNHTRMCRLHSMI